MKLERQVSILIFSLSGLLLGWNLLTPDNPHHFFNIFEDVTCLSVIGFSMMASRLIEKVSRRMEQIIQCAMIGSVAFATASSQPDLFFSGVLTVILFVLIHAYGAFKTHALWKLPASILSIFILCAISSSRFTFPGPEALGRAAMWTLFVVGFLFLLWLALQEFRGQFHEQFAAKLIEQNRQLLELNKQLSRGCDDGNTT